MRSFFIAAVVILSACRVHERQRFQEKKPAPKLRASDGGGLAADAKAGNSFGPGLPDSAIVFDAVTSRTTEDARSASESEPEIWPMESESESESEIPPGLCGDQACELKEDCFLCPDDCGRCPVCGDRFCEERETCILCPEDCGDCSSESCCAAHDGPGCGDAYIQYCVCLESPAFSEPFCCIDAWDKWCVATIEYLGCWECD